MPILIWILLEMSFFFFTANQVGFLYTLALYWVPTWLIFRVFQGPLFRPQTSPWLKIAWTLIGLPSAITRFVGLIALIPGVPTLLSNKAKKRFEENVQNWQSRSQFSTFVFRSGSVQFESENYPTEIKDVTPKKTPPPDLLN